MIHVAQLSIPPKTELTSPVTSTIKLTPGRLTKVTVQYLPGCCNLVGIWFEYHGQKVLPWNPEGILYGDAYIFNFEFGFTLDSEPYDFICKGYSLDDIYTHVIYITVNLEADIPERVATFKTG